MVKCEIKLDRNVFYSGECISGNILLGISKPIIAQKLFLEIFGIAECNWSQYASNHSMFPSCCECLLVLKSEHYSGTENYLNFKMNLGGSNECEPFELQPTIRVYPFSFELPKYLPSSYEGEFGYIRYMVRVTFQHSHKCCKKYVKNFTVNTQYNLNHLVCFGSPREILVTNTCSKLFRESSSISMLAKIPRCGYVASEIIDVTVCLGSDANVLIKSFEFCIRENTTFRSQTPREIRKFSYVTVMKVVTKFGKKVDSVVRIREFIQVPELCATNSYCHVVDVSYSLIITAILGGFHSDVKVELPLVIGTVPIVKTYDLVNV